MNRRELIAITSGVAAAGLLSSKQSRAEASGAGEIRFGVATYSLRQFRRSMAIHMIQQTGVTLADVKEFHLPYNDSPDELKKGHAEFEKAGIQILSGGNITLKENDKASMKKWFDYARNAGLPIMVCAPTRQNIKVVEELAKEYDVRMAIHNHGPEDKEFPSPQSVLEVVKDMDPRMGLCIDIGHTSRAGSDIVKSIREAGPRLFEMHFKDLKDPKGKESQCVVGEGVLPIPAIFRELIKIGYKGVCSLEYEIDEDNPLPGMMRSFAYMRGVVAGMQN